MLRLIDLTYYSYQTDTDPDSILERQYPAIGFADSIKGLIDIEFVKHLDCEDVRTINGIRYSFFRNSNSFFSIPLRTHSYIQKACPDVVLVQGLIYPFQVIALRLTLSKKCKIIVQHHGEFPYSGLKRIFQRIADKFIDAYLFTSLGNARPWIAAKIVPSIDKCFEILEASTSFRRINKEEARRKTGVTGATNFLWVGRLDANKDPFTVLKAFEKYLEQSPTAHLYMLYHETHLLGDIKDYIEKNAQLCTAIKLIGKVEHKNMIHWFNACDYFISASHKEAAGYSLLEAMSCGCIPIVTDIPPFLKITADGKYGLLYKKGEPESLYKQLISLKALDYAELSSQIEKYFNTDLSFASIAARLSSIGHSVYSK